MVVQHNISAMTANRYYGVNNSALGKSLEKLASGYAINRAGDNAAGLAVSEKMRAQIGGLTQASKNAEDGISLVQTFEGALQETDSILQRMRTLAVQSANGSYQDDVDREAMQLEFDQLNDELNQIADTDFNGVVMLNGGQMADGLKAVDGKFDYANYKRSAIELGASDIDMLDSLDVDNASSSHGTHVMDDIWNGLNSTWDRGDATKADGPDSLDVTFQYDSSTRSWSAIGATNGADYHKVEVTQGATVNGAVKDGGFRAKVGTNEFANVVMSYDNLQNGDTITLTLSNPKSEVRAPGNGGVNVTDTSQITEGEGSTSIKKEAIGAEVTIKAATNGGGDNGKMSETRLKQFDAINGMEISMKYEQKGGTGTDASDGKKQTASSFSFKFSDGTEFTPTGTDEAEVTLADGTKLGVTVTDAGLVTFNDAKGGNELMKIQLQGVRTADDPTDNTKGIATLKIGLDDYKYDTSELPTVEVKDPASRGVSKSNAFDQSKATMTYADNMYLQVGARTKDEVNFTFKYASNGLGGLKANLNCSSRTDGLGTADLSLKTAKDANAAIDKIDNALNKVNMVRATFGAVQNRLEHKINNIDTNTENLTAAESRIRDTQMDKEMMKFTSSQILSQASQSMLAQANSLPQGVLQLLG